MHHYLNDLPIIMALAIKNIDIFIYIKGQNFLKHPDEKHAYNFKLFINLLKRIKEASSILGEKKLFTKTDIPSLK